MDVSINRKLCFIWTIFKYKDYKKNVLLLWFIVPWIIIFFMPHFKAAEYGLGFVPAIILFASLYVSNIKKKRFQNQDLRYISQKKQ